MCTGSTSLGLQIGGGLYSAVGSYYAASSQKTALKGQATLADTNARLSELQAQSAILQGQREEQKSRLATANLKSSQRASMAANGVDLGSDTAVNILTTTDTMGEIDANTINANAARAAWGYRTQATNYKNEALMTRATAKSINPFMAAGTSLLTSAGAVSANWYKLGKEGALSGTMYGKVYDYFNKGA